MCSGDLARGSNEVHQRVSFSLSSSRGISGPIELWSRPFPSHMCHAPRGSESTVPAHRRHPARAAPAALRDAVSMSRTYGKDRGREFLGRGLETFGTPDEWRMIC